MLKWMFEGIGPKPKINEKYLKSDQENPNVEGILVILFKSL